MQARKAQRHSRKRTREVKKAHVTEGKKGRDRAQLKAGRTLAKVATLLAQLEPRVHDANNEETETFKQLRLLTQTRVKASIEELKTLKQISSACLSGSISDVEFEDDDVNKAVGVATDFLKTITKPTESAAAGTWV